MKRTRDRLGAWVVGVVEGLLLLRLVALLFAARPDNPLVAGLLAITLPLTLPLTALDRWAGQPRFGARLELATVAAMLIVALVALAIRWRGARQAQTAGES